MGIGNGKSGTTSMKNDLKLLEDYNYKLDICITGSDAGYVTSDTVSRLLCRKQVIGNNVEITGGLTWYIGEEDTNDITIILKNSSDYSMPEVANQEDNGSTGPFFSVYYKGVGANDYSKGEITGYTPAGSTATFKVDSAYITGDPTVADSGVKFYFYPKGKVATLDWKPSGNFSGFSGNVIRITSYVKNTTMELPNFTSAFCGEHIIITGDASTGYHFGEYDKREDYKDFYAQSATVTGTINYNEYINDGVGVTGNIQRVFNKSYSPMVNSMYITGAKITGVVWSGDNLFPEYASAGVVMLTGTLTGTTSFNTGATTVKFDNTFASSYDVPEDLYDIDYSPDNTKMTVTIYRNRITSLNIDDEYVSMHNLHLIITPELSNKLATPTVSFPSADELKVETSDDINNLHAKIVVNDGEKTGLIDLN